MGKGTSYVQSRLKKGWTATHKLGDHHAFKVKERRKLSGPSHDIRQGSPNYGEQLRQSFQVHLWV